jgi:hypothetical protein
LISLLSACFTLREGKTKRFFDFSPLAICWLCTPCLHGVVIQVGGNYAPTIKPAVQSFEQGCAQVLWLYPEGDDHLVTEV